MRYINTAYGTIAAHSNDLIGNLLERDSIWEPYNIAIMEKYIAQGSTVLDIGANIGFFSVVLSKIVGENGTVVAFEPIEENYKVLEVNTTNLTNVQLCKYALGNVTGVVSMHSEVGNKGNSYVVNESEGDIDIRRLDDLNLSPSFIKMDVQGFEYDVLLGGLETLRRCRPVMIIELEDSNPSIPTSYKESKLNSIRLLKEELNYTLYNIESDYPVDYLCIPN
jgi:FkbM family methyltransferase